MHQSVASSRRKSLRWLLLALILIPLLVAASGCNLSSVPSARTTPTASASQSQTGPTPQTGTQTGQTQPPVQAGGWQIPAEQQAVVKVVEQVGPAVVTVVNRIESGGLGG